MAEAQTYVFDYKEVAEALVKKQGIHEGLWGIYMEFGIGGGSIPGPSENTLVPTAIIPVVKIGIHRFDKPNPLTVDAAEINPPSTESPKLTRRAQNLRRKRVKKEKV
ncbi:MAG TPA: hypothetical protein VIH59_00335 [Candidatus Tectomicrobia bacterium]|jgi:hypothetical protein